MNPGSLDKIELPQALIAVFYLVDGPLWSGNSPYLL
jgi:hypothetical protein